jgi:sensor domain CHASE-containing protein
MTATTDPTIDAFAWWQGVVAVDRRLRQAHLSRHATLVAGGRGLAGTDPLLAGWAKGARLAGHGTAEQPAT